ncbi:hypothetical protein IVB22_28000 [Bradyrhizobium sp. 190]|uniref:hypothetical protein n=1 Tax=Bradyrhizobium sp. 190 TaxID=2782658 RepID=UPI001FF9988E|nr:hypothetical protein [Bradyrhizobium sp. 190]MCK1516283.1 hypothetical protein [Bradyrhizobium sp. 190]
MGKKPTHSEPQDEAEKEALLKSLRKHGQVVESEDPDVPLGPGQTHVLVKKRGESGGRLIEKRKSFIKR